MNEYPYETPYKALHFTAVGRAFTRRLRQLCWFRQPGHKDDLRALEVTSWPPYTYKTPWGSTTEETIAFGSYLYENVMYRLVNEIRRPGRPYAHHMSRPWSPEAMLPWIKAIIRIDNPGSSPEIEAVLATVMGILTLACAADPIRAPKSPIGAA